MKFSDKFSSPYLKAIDLPTRRERVTIKEIIGEWMGNPKEHKYVVYFAEFDKGLVLNVTNGKTLQQAFGDDVTACIEKVVDLVVKAGQSPQGADMDVVRIEVPAHQSVSRPNDAELNRRLDEAAAPEHAGDDDIPF